MTVIATQFLTRFLGVLRNYISISWIKGASPHHVVGAQCQNVHPMAMTLQCSAQNSLGKIQCIIIALAYFSLLKLPNTTTQGYVSVKKWFFSFSLLNQHKCVCTQQVTLCSICVKLMFTLCNKHYFNEYISVLLTNYSSLV